MHTARPSATSCGLTSPGGTDRADNQQTPAISFAFCLVLLTRTRNRAPDAPAPTPVQCLSSSGIDSIGSSATRSTERTSGVSGTAEQLRSVGKHFLEKISQTALRVCPGNEKKQKILVQRGNCRNSGTLQPLSLVLSSLYHKCRRPTTDSAPAKDSACAILSTANRQARN